MSDGLFAILGVVVGALATGGVQAAFELRQERHRSRVAARLVGEEIIRNLSVVTMILDDGEWPPPGHPKAVIRREAWDQNKGALAQIQSSSPWAELSIAYTDVDQFGIALEYQAGQQIDSHAKEDLQDSVETLNRAIEALASYMEFDEEE